MSASSLALNSDATIRFGDAVCTDGDFDIAEEKYRTVLKTSAPVGLRALRDRRLIALRQSSSMISSSSATSSMISGGGGGAGGSAGVDMWVPATSDEIPVSPSILKFASGPSKGNYQKRQPSRVPSKNREELERIAKLINGDDEEDETELDDDAALLRTAMVDAKKKQKAQKEAADTAAALSQSGNTIAQYHYQTHQVSEREKEYIDMVNESMTTILGMSTVRLFGVVQNVDRTHATVEVWRKGGVVFTERRPVERLPLNHLQKLSKREFTLVCNRPLVSFTHGRTRKAQTGAAALEDMPATLMSHTNEIVESLIQKMETTAKIQKQAVADELLSMEEHKQAQKNKRMMMNRSPDRSGNASPTHQATGISMFGSPASSYAGTPQLMSRAGSFGKQQQHHHHHHQQRMALGAGTPPPPPVGSSINLATLRASSNTPNDANRNASFGSVASSSAGNKNNTHYYSGKEVSTDERRHFGKFKLAFSKDRHKLFRGPSLKNRQDAQSRAPLPETSPLLERYFNSSGTTPCGTSVIRSLPEPPVTRLIDPLVDVRDELKALSVMNNSDSTSASAGGNAGMSWTPQSKYIQDIHQSSNQRSNQHNNSHSKNNKDAPGLHDTSYTSFTSLLPVLGGTVHGNANNQNDTTQNKNTSKNTSLNNNTNATAASMTQSKLLPLQPSFVEKSLAATSPPRVSGGSKTTATASPRSIAGGASPSSPAGSPRSLLGGTVSSSFGSKNYKNNNTRKSVALRIPQPVPPALLYSSYSADAELLPPEISCTVVEYRQNSQTLLLSIRRNTFGTLGGGVGGGGNNSKNNSPSGTGRRTGSHHNVKTSARSVNSNKSIGSTTSANKHTEEEMHARWNQALSGLSTILVKCAFVDILSYLDIHSSPNASFGGVGAQNSSVSEDTTTNLDGTVVFDETINSNTINHDHHHQRNKPQQQQQQNLLNVSQGAPALKSSSFGSYSDALGGGTNSRSASRPLSPTTSTSVSYQNQQQQQQRKHGSSPPVSSSNSHGNRAGTGEVIVNCGDAYLQNLVGKTVDVIPLRTEWVDGQCAVVADILRGDLSILDEMISSKYAVVSSMAKNEYDYLKSTFGQQQVQKPGTFRGKDSLYGSGTGTQAELAQLSPSSNASFTSGAFGPMVVEQQGSGDQQQVSPGGRKENNNNMMSNSDSDVLLLQHSNSHQAMQKMKSGFFSAQTAQAVLERDPDLVINAAESFLGRRVFRLLEASKSSNLKMEVLKNDNNNNTRNNTNTNLNASGGLVLSNNSSFAVGRVSLTQDLQQNLGKVLEEEGASSDDENNSSKVQEEGEEDQGSSSASPDVQQQPLSPTRPFNRHGTQQMLTQFLNVSQMSAVTNESGRGVSNSTTTIQPPGSLSVTRIEQVLPSQLSSSLERTQNEEDEEDF